MIHYKKMKNLLGKHIIKGIKNGLKTQRDHLFNVVNTTQEGENPVRDMLILLLKNNPNGLNYANFIQDNTTFRKSYRRLR
jgi:hypothetical protein